MDTEKNILEDIPKEIWFSFWKNNPVDFSALVCTSAFWSIEFFTSVNLILESYRETAFYMTQYPQETILGFIKKYYNTSDYRYQELEQAVINSDDSDVWSVACYALITNDINKLPIEKLKAIIESLEDLKDSESKDSKSNNISAKYDDLIMSLRVIEKALNDGVETVKSLSSNSCSYYNLSGLVLPKNTLLMADLLLPRGIVLTVIDLQGVNLSGVSMQDVNLSGANLSRANLSGAFLRGAYLKNTILCNANLQGTSLCGGAVLSNAQLVGANLEGAIFKGTALVNANLSGANLSNTDLRTSVNLEGADLSGARWNQKTLFPLWSLSKVKFLSANAFVDGKELMAGLRFLEPLIAGHSQEDSLKSAVIKQSCNELDNGSESAGIFIDIINSSDHDLPAKYDQMQLLVKDYYEQNDTLGSGFGL